MNYSQAFGAKTIRIDDVLTGPFWPEPVKVIRVEQVGLAVSITWVGLSSGQYGSRIFLPEDLEKIEVKSLTKVPNQLDSELFFLGIEAHRIRLAYEFDPQLAVNVSQIDPLPHQIEAVYEYILRKPRIRFLLADDPGAGKTIMAGLVLKELKYRGLANRILIVVPGHLKFQWHRELKEKFGEHFETVDRHVMNAFWGRNVWLEINQCITSMDFAKQDDVLESLREAHWDLVIVDEAHKLSAFKYGKRIKKTKRFRLGEVLSNNSTHLLFLSATPHRGDPGNFLLLLSLLEPNLFTKSEILEQSINRKENPLILRRMKENMKDLYDRPLFPQRNAETIKYKLSPAEKKLYDEVTNYVSTYYRKALDKENRNVALALLILQRRLASSVRAIRRSLERRRERLKEMLRERTILRGEGLEIPEELDDLPESEKWKYEEKLERLTIAENLEELRDEIEEVERLVELAKNVEKMEVETKLVELKKVMDDLNLIGEGHKLLIFTEAKDTLEYLVEKLREWGYRVTYIHGGMSPEDRIRAEKEFRERAQVLVGTEAAGEGINLQFCWLVVNYDIPWNPNRLEQRMGRVHRYGQKHEVYVYNMVSEDTREGAILHRLLEKLKIMKKHLGSDRVFDVIGQVFEGISLERLIKDAIANKRTVDEIIQMIDSIPDQELVEKVRKATAESLAIRHIDLSKVKKLNEEAEINRLVPEYIEGFFLKAFERFGGKVVRRKGGILRIPRVPAELRRITSEFKQKFGEVYASYPKVTFYKEIAKADDEAEFVAPRHPLLETLVERVIKEFQRSYPPVGSFIDPKGRMDGLIWFVEGEVKDGLGNMVGKRLFAVYQEANGALKLIPASILWDLEPSSRSLELEEIQQLIEQEEPKVLSFLISSPLSEYRSELKRKRAREIEIKRKYGLRSLNALLEEKWKKLSELKEQQLRGKDVKKYSIQRAKDDVERIRARIEEFKRSITLESSLSLVPPVVIGIVIVRPAQTGSEEGFAESSDIERIGMEEAMKFERMQGRIPEDVSERNLGFDIRSSGPSEVRYIEVKARASSGPVALTPNEWIAAQRFREKYWLYIVTDAARSPKLYPIQNPMAKLKPREEIRIVKYVIPEEEWRKASQMAE